MLNPNYMYKYRILMAKREYHKRIWEILNNQLRNTIDLEERRRLYARRSFQRRTYRKYEALAQICWDTME